MMIMSRAKEWIIEIVSALFVVRFIYAAATKLMDYDKFMLQIGQSPVLTAFAGVVVWRVPAIEVVIAMLLMTKRLRLAGLYASF